MDQGRVKLFLDTEFIEDGRTIDLVSIGLVREDGAELYLESSEVDWSKANAWVELNVRPHLGPEKDRVTRADIADLIFAFVGNAPVFHAYYADYDWVALCQLYGRMIDLPRGWPQFCRDLMQTMSEKGLTVHDVPKQTGTAHHALADARWVRDTYNWLENR